MVYYHTPKDIGRKAVVAVDDIITGIYYLASIGDGYWFVDAKYTVHGLTDNLNIALDGTAKKLVTIEIVEQLRLVVEETLNLLYGSEDIL